MEKSSIQLEHIARHKMLHENLDELVADYSQVTGKFMLTESSIWDLLEWSSKQF